MQAKQAGLVLGTDKTCLKLEPPHKWDRGILHKLDGKGFRGFVSKYFGPLVIKFTGLSPIRLYKETQDGTRKETDGIIAYIMRKHADFYDKGIKVLIVDNIPDVNDNNNDLCSIEQYDLFCLQDLNRHQGFFLQALATISQ